MTPSWKLAPRPRSKHEKRTAGSAWETWTVAAADGVCCARVRWEINFLLTFETAPFFCVYPVCTIYFLHNVTQVLCFVIKLVTVTEEPCLQSRIQTYNFLGTWNVRSLSNKSGYKRGNKCNLVFRYVCSTFMKFKWNPGYFINALTLSTFFYMQ